MRRKITGETWEQMKTGYAAGIGRRELPVCSCVSITLSASSQTRITNNLDCGRASR
jgi:hypothetical protein